MKVGINLLLWTGAITEGNLKYVKSLIRQIKKWGYDLVEMPVFHYDEKVFKAIRAELDANGLGATAITVMPGKRVNPTSPNKIFRQAAIQHLKGALDMAAVLNSPILGGPLYSALGYKPGPPTADEHKRAKEVIQEACVHARSLGIPFALEPLNRFETHFLNTLFQANLFAEDVGDPQCGIMPDSFHQHIEEEDDEEALKKVAARVIHAHASESHRGTPGKGQVRWMRYFKGLQYATNLQTIVIESFSSEVKEIAAAACIWRPVSPDQEVVATEGLAFVKRMLAEAA